LSAAKGSRARFVGRARPPRLVLRFVLLTALGLAAAGAVILVIDRHADTIQAQRQAIERARFATTAVLRHELRADDLRRPIPTQRKRQLDSLFRARVLSEGILRGTVYGGNGRAVYSSDGRFTGRQMSAGDLEEALSGTVVSRVASSADGGRVFRTYVPAVLGPRRVQAVVALEQDYAPIVAAAQRSSWLIAGVLELLLLLLLLIFVPVLARVSGRVRRHLAELEQVATYDELVGLPNRLGFRRAVNRTVSARGGSSALLLLDLTGFHEINDALGSESGDALLAQVAERLQQGLDDCALVARLGEDEFGLLLQTGDEEKILAIAERAQHLLVSPFIISGVPVAVDANIGVGVLSEGALDVDTALRHAGVALSIAKEAGTASIQIYDPSHDASDVRRLSLLAELRESIDSGQLLVYYQPQADLTTRAIRGVEALLRWQHPSRGLLNAGVFIAQAERSGIAKALTRFVLQTAGRQWQEWSALPIRPDLAVNLSTIDLLDTTLADEISALLDEYGIPAENLVLEITERTLVADPRRARSLLERLDEIGVRIAIDDFGTGTSSLATLRDYPIRQIKLDQSFLAGIPGDPTNEQIVYSTVEIAHTLGATVVAEGVETNHQWERIATLGCDIAQGFLIGRPMPADQLTRILQTHPGPARVVAA
jgi:diguanylate cyclase